MAARPDRLTLAAFVAMVLLAGANAVGVRLTVAEMPPLWGATIRFALAGGLLAVVMIATRRPIPRGDRLVGSALFGVLGFGLAYSLIYVALQDAPAGTAQLMLSVTPLLTLFLARLHGVEQIRKLAIVGAVIAAAGIAIVVGDQVTLDVPVLALLMLLGTAACAAESNVIVKRFPPGDPVAANAVGMLLGATLLGTLSVVLGEPHVLPERPETWVAIGYLVVFGSVAVFILALYVLSRWTASATSYSFLLFPLITIVLGALILAEPVQPTFLIGGALVLAGVYVGAVYRPRRRLVDPLEAVPDTS
ncbi:MAG TPA: EamA family transporter [Vitreimonas sp.]|nr:EamA family transporter [Vitreimonas sp.]